MGRTFPIFQRYILSGVVPFQSKDAPSLICVADRYSFHWSSEVTQISSSNSTTATMVASRWVPVVRVIK